MSKIIFEKADLTNFPADECVIPLKINTKFFKSENTKLMLLNNDSTNSLNIKKVYPCLGEMAGTEVYGFVGVDDFIFYNILEEDVFVFDEGNLNIILSLLKEGIEYES